MTEASSTIALFPDFTNLQAEVEKLRTQMSMLLLEKDELLFVECKNIQMAYMLALGNLEYKAYELHCEVLRLKRKMELIQAKKNRQEKVLLYDIEKTLDEEFAEYQVQLEDQIDKMNAALERSKGKLLSDKESQELKKLYRSVVKSLHPDLNPDISDAKVILFNNAIWAYENGDLNGLRLISTMVSESVKPDANKNGMVILAKEKERIKNLLKVLHDKIAKIKSEYPYTMKSLIQSEEKIAEKKSELEDTIAQLRESLELYKFRIREMLR